MQSLAKVHFHRGIKIENTKTVFPSQTRFRSRDRRSAVVVFGLVGRDRKRDRKRCFAHTVYYEEFQEKVEIFAGEKQKTARKAQAFGVVFCFSPAKIEIFREIPSNNEIF
jgi:hypothetical protein